jgi:hypothetical protein
MAPSSDARQMGAGIVFGERSTADRIFELIARHRPWH